MHGTAIGIDLRKFLTPQMKNVWLDQGKEGVSQSMRKGKRCVTLLIEYVHRSD